MTEAPRITHVLLVLDKSGSMYELAADVRGGFNDYIGQLKADGSACRLTMVLFDHRYHRPLIDAPLDAAPVLTEKNYAPGGNTALLDAIGQVLTDFKTAHGDLAEDERAILFVHTDGMENSSREYSLDTVKRMIQERTDTGRWMTLFVGAGPDTWWGGRNL